MYKVFIYKIIPGQTAMQLEYESPDFKNIVEAELSFAEKVAAVIAENGYKYGFGDCLYASLEKGRRGTCDTLAGFWLRLEQLAGQCIKF